MNLKDWLKSFKKKRNLINLLTEIKNNSLGAVILKGFVEADISIVLFGNKENYINLLNDLQKKGTLMYIDFSKIKGCINKEDLELSSKRFYYHDKDYSKDNFPKLLFDLMMPILNQNQEEYFDYAKKTYENAFSI